MKRFIGVLAVCCSMFSFGVAAAADMPQISQQELLQLQQQNPDQLVLDVRSAQEYAAGHVPGAINISHDELPHRWQELDGEQRSLIVLYCRSGRRAGIAAELLTDKGFTNLRHLQGDMNGWQAAKLPEAKGE